MVSGLVIATLAAALITFVDAAHAHAATCTVNGVSTTAQYINGTPGDDIIACGAIPQSHSVRGLDGNDTITTGNLTGGGVNGGGGNDTITTGPIEPGILLSGKLLGDTGDDILRAPSVRSNFVGPYILHSLISAGPGNDIVEGTTPGTPVIANTESIVSGGTGTDSCNVQKLGGTVLDCE
jgi:hypothetical protein